MTPLTVMADMMLAACVDVAMIHTSIADAREQGRPETEVLQIMRRTMPLDIYEQAAPGVYNIYNLPREQMRPAIQSTYEQCVNKTDKHLREQARRYQQ